MDDFRMQQKRESLDGSQRGARRPYGCSCCRRVAALALHKRIARKRARARVADADRRAAKKEAQR